jgi:hypothetical protein
MGHSPQYVRLFIATAGAVSSVAFAAACSFLMTPIIRDRVHYVVQTLPLVTYAFQHYAWHALVVPLSLLMAGIMLLRRKKTGVAFEMVVGSQWLFSLLCVICCLLVWLLPELSYSETIR